MAFSEQIKNFDRLRDYMRSFFIYGYKTRADFAEKSARTYDNERRRIESWLGDYTHWGYGKNGKRVFLSVDSAKIPQNPLYRAYGSKSFTGNDILLHFFLLDLFEDFAELTAGQAADEISRRYGEEIDAQTVRGKLREYAEAGLLCARRQGKALAYSRENCFVEQLFPHQEDARDFLAFFGECAPFSVVGSYLLSRLKLANTRLLFKHHFLAHTLDDTVLLPLCQAIETRQRVELVNFSRRADAPARLVGLPLAVLVSTQTGRRYLAFFSEKPNRFYSLRLDYIQAVKPLGPCPGAEALRAEGERRLAGSWGVSLPGRGRPSERFAMTIQLDEEKESYILARLKREGRGGTLEQLAPGRWRYTVQVADSGELLPWVRSFTGRILAVEGDNALVVARFYRDLRRMQALYGEVT